MIHGEVARVKCTPSTLTTEYRKLERMVERCLVKRIGELTYSLTNPRATPLPLSRIL